MSAFKEALRRKMADVKQKPGMSLDIIIGGDAGQDVRKEDGKEGDAEFDKDGGSDSAPPVADDAPIAGHPDEAQDKELILNALGKSPSQQGLNVEDPKTHQAIMQAILDRSPMGRSPSSLGERAAALAKSKMGSMKK